MTWITKGGKIENYIPENLIKEYYLLSNKKTQFNQYDNIEDFLDRLKIGEGKKFLKNKIEFAKKTLESKSKQDFQDIYVLDDKMKKVIRNIENWNKR